MTSRIKLSAQKPAATNDLSFCLPSIYDGGDGGGGGKSLSEIAFNPTTTEAIASSFLSVAPPTISDAVIAAGNFAIPNNGLRATGISLVAGQTYTISVRGTGATPIPDPIVFMDADTDGDGVFIQVPGGTFGFLDPDDFHIVDDDGGDGLNSMITYTATYTGTHVFVVGAAGSGQGGQYRIEVVQQDNADESDSFGAATQLTLGSLYYGFIDFVPNVGQRPYGKDFGEVDTFKVTLEAGKAYIIEASGGGDYLSDFSALPPGEVDTVMVIYGPDGSVIQNDDASFASGDIGSAVAFIAPATGTYFIDLFAYAPQTGGYSLVAREVSLAGLDPLDAIDWKSADNIDPGPDGVVKVYFAIEDESFGELADNGEDPLPSFGWNAWEKQQLFAALQEFSKVLGITYVETDNAAEADFRLITTTSTQYGAYFYPQDPAFGDAQGIGAFNVDSGGWAFDQQQSLTQGGFAFAVILHEFGHAHGLAHPHDTGGGSDVLAGVFGPFDSYGFFDLNQGVYTVMSYNDAWPLHPDGPSPFTVAGIDNGWSGTLSAFDIALLQQRYGVHPDFATGNDIYTLNDVQGVGTFYKTIYDTGGIDEIRYIGERNAHIDLTAATLDYSPTGGGVLSFVRDIKGGYTIANGIVIENATGDRGDDVLIGNAAANVLTGMIGKDVLLGRAGNDTLDGGNGDDMLDGGAGNDVLVGGRGGDIFAFDDGSGNDLISDFRRGDDKLDLGAIDANTGAAGDQAFTWIGSGAFTGTAGQLRSFSSGGSSFVAGDVNGDGAADFVIQTNVLVTQTDILFI